MARTKSPEKRIEAVLASFEARVRQLELDHNLERAIVDQMLDTSQVALLRAVHSADFIERLIEMTPSLTKRQHDELRGVADDLLQFAARVGGDAFQDGMRQLAAGTANSRKPDVLDGVLGWVRDGKVRTGGEREPDLLDRFFRWLRG